MIRKNTLRLLLAASLVATGSAHAQTSGTLQKIANSDTIVLGVRPAVVPFSYYDDQQKSIGYSQDIALAIVGAVKQKLNRPNLTVRTIAITPQNRIPLLVNGTIDIECSTTTNDAERQKQAAFSNTIFIIGTRLLTKKNSGIKDFADLKGRTVVTNAGSTSEQILHRLDTDQHLGAVITTQKDVAESFLALSTGRADAFMLDDAMLAGERAKAPDPDDYVIVGKPQSKEAYGCMFRKDDPDFKKVVDDAVARLQTSGQADVLYRKWFDSPIPPGGINLHLPESDDLKALFKAPNDKPLS
ncbi:amino acid ABC transporter substrate-binding protein [Burkholderia sp. WAC0059]|uniref:glutamate/aspartate ABC transporter substrate-binding protein n=1 Tax=Burkholderia sp. WAC0059 TaxID=2066022 RepID=UPI000C7F6C7F|nr:glutamate/aspartate ABC transporter substrate-binding protein [Burkholderia sp. WAC0059]PLZ02917.1 amino acid ABC transporter substrate-binding protein [Burkholderia sp. WAC0059]